MRYVENTSFHLFQQLTEVVVVERQSSHEEGVQNHPARPNIRFSTVVFFTL